MYSLHNILLQLKSPWHFLGLLLPKIPAHLPWGYDGWTISLWNSMNFNRTIKKHVWGAQLCLSLLNNLENFFLVDIFLIVWQGWTCYRNRHVTFWVIHPLSQCLAEVIFFFFCVITTLVCVCACVCWKWAWGHLQGRVIPGSPSYFSQRSSGRPLSRATIFTLAARSYSSELRDGQETLMAKRPRTHF